MIALRESRPILFGLLALILLGCVTACEPTDAQLLKSFAQDWAISRGIDAWAGDAVAADQVKAAREAKSVVDKLEAADKLANDGLANGDIKKVDKAIAMRPNDFTYVNDRGLINLTGGNFIQTQADFAKADSLAATQGQNAQILNLRNRLDGLRQSTSPDPNRTTVLCTTSQALYKITNNKGDLAPGC